MSKSSDTRRAKKRVAKKRVAKKRNVLQKGGNETYSLTLEIIPIYKNSLSLYRYDTNSKEWNYVKNEKRVNKKQMKILSYNLWGALKDSNSPLFAFDNRSKCIIKLLKSCNADVLCLQEVSKVWLEYLLNNDWLKKNYYCTEKNGDRVHIKFGLGNVIFSKFPLDNIIEYGLASLQMDTALYAEILVNDKTISLVTSQLHSQSEYTDFRIIQLKTIFNDILREKENAIFVGDYNFGDNVQKWKENNYLDKSYKDAYRDLYPDNGKNPGYTEDTEINEMRYMMKKSHKQERFDKLMYKSNFITPIKFDIIGKDKIGSVTFENSKIGIWPSDHFGIYCEMKTQ